MGMMLSVQQKLLHQGAYENSHSNWRIAFSAHIDLYPMVCPLRPQKVQWLRSPHQHPRDVSKNSTGSTGESGRSVAIRSNDSMNEP
jgi:hypothetical protein